MSDRVTDLTTLIDPFANHARSWFVLVSLCFSIACLLPIAATYTVLTGIGTWGDNIPVGWGFAIVQFVWWIGIGHAGTFLSAILLVADQRWRAPLHRIAESMTLFAVLMAAIFPLLHMGRSWFFYWTIPYPATYEVWPQFGSALTWDVAAILTYLTVSILFFYVGLLPDLASRRDHTRWPWSIPYALACFGWRGSARHWEYHGSVQRVLSGIATPLVVSVHSIVSLDFATTLLPGWHSPIFPPYFVAGAISSGLAMVAVIVVPLRSWLGMQKTITDDHLDRLGALLLAAGWVVIASYACEHLSALASGDGIEHRMLFHTRPFGPHAPLYWITVFGNVIALQALWFRSVRRSPVLLSAVSVAVAVAMWTERAVLILTSQEQDFLPSSWRMFLPSPVDAALLAGTLGTFALLLLLLFRVIPFVAIADLEKDEREQVLHA